MDVPQRRWRAGGVARAGLDLCCLGIVKFVRSLVFPELLVMLEPLRRAQGFYGINIRRSLRRRWLTVSRAQCSVRLQRPPLSLVPECRWSCDEGCRQWRGVRDALVNGYAP